MKRLFTLFFVFALYTLSFAQLSGDYYIPQGVNPQGYASLSAAITDLNANGCTGTVNFYIDGDLAETGASLLITRSDLTSTNNLVIKPAPTKAPIINITGCTATAGANQYAGFTLSGASYITIDGSNNGSSSRDLSFVMNDATGRDGIVLYGNCDNIILKNFKLRYVGIQSTTTGRGIYLNGQASGACDNAVINNCEIGENSTTLVGPHHGIGYTGSSSSSIYCMNGTISNNLIYANIRGLNLFWHNGVGSTMNVYGNTISIMNPASGNVTWGILHQNYTGTTNFYSNRIQSITQKSTNTQGVYAFGTLNGVAGAGTITNLYNNFLGGAFDHTGSGVPASIDVISFQDAPAGSVVKVYHNTVVLNNMTKTASSRMTAMRFNPAAGSTFDIKNNIFINNKDAAVAFCLHFGGAATTFTSDYNNIYVSGASANVGYYNSLARQTLVNWQTASTQDANSKSKSVTFVSATDLHLDGSSNGDVDLLGTTITLLENILYDIDGDLRLGAPQGPYMGADEASNPLPIELKSFNVSVDNGQAKLSWQTITEINSSMFEVQRQSENSIWSKIADIPAAGNSNSPKDYSYTDRKLASGKYQYRLKMIDANGIYKYSDVVEIEITMPREFVLSQNYPNPFNPSTVINYTIPFETEVRLEVYSVNGELVKTLVSGTQIAGNYSVELNASDLASGTYIYRLAARDFVQSKKMQLIK